MVAVVGAGVAGDAGLVTAEQLVDGLVVELAGDVPEGDVDGGEADAGDLTQGASDFGVDELALEGAAADQKVGEGGQGGVFSAAAAGVFADDSLVGFDAEDAALGLDAVARFIDEVEAVVVFAEVFSFALVGMDFDFGDDWSAMVDPRVGGVLGLEVGTWKLALLRAFM